MGLESKGYTISAEQFRSFEAPTRRFYIGHPVERDNWTSFMITGFRLAQGDVNSHQLFVLHAHLSSGIKITETLTNYSLAGGWSILRPDEVKLISDGYLQARQPGRHALFDDTFGEKFDEQLNRLKTVDMPQRFLGIIGAKSPTVNELAAFGEEDLMKLIAERVKAFKEFLHTRPGV